MKKILHITGILLLILPFWGPVKGDSFRLTYKRNINLSFQVKDHAAFNLENKYGNIHFYQWDKNQIKATITITVKAGNDEEAKKIADGITIEKNQGGNRVSLRTDYSPSGSSSVWSMLFGSTSGGKKSVRIDYEVYLPQSLATLSVSNKYGNIAGSRIPGAVNIDLSYGHFSLDNIQKPLNFQVKYGSGSLTNLSDAIIEAAYTDFNMDGIKRLKMHFKYSDLVFGTADNILLDGSYGDISAKSISQLQSNTSYGDYKIENLERGATITTAYGDVHINRTRALKQLKISARYSDIFLGVSRSQPLQVNVQLNYGDFGSNGLTLQNIEKGNKGSRTTFIAHSPGAGANAGRIVIEGSYSDVKLWAQ